MDMITLTEYMNRERKFKARMSVFSWWLPLVVLLVIGAFLLLCLLFLLSKYSEPSDISSWMQVIVEITLIPLAVLAFWITFREVAKTYIRADLMVLIGIDELSSARVELVHPGQKGTQSNLVRLALNNCSDIPVKFWDFNLWLPIGLWGGTYQESWTVHPSETNKVISEHYKHGEFLHIKLRSFGGHPIGAELLEEIGFLRILIDSNSSYQRDPYICRWSIRGERLEEASGIFEIVVPTL